MKRDTRCRDVAGICDHCHEEVAVYLLEWSDRESYTCASCIVDALVSVAFDHATDRGNMAVHHQRVSRDGPILDVSRLLDAARRCLNEIRPGWRDRTLDDDDDGARSQLTDRLRAECGAQGHDA